MKSLFKFTISKEFSYKKYCLYVMMDTKQNAIEYVEKHLNNGFKISNICKLGEERSGCLYSSLYKK